MINPLQSLFRSCSVATIAILFLAVSNIAQDDTRVSSATWQVESYKLALATPADERDRTLAINAELGIKNVAGRAVSSLTLRMNSAIDVTSIKINGAAVELARSEQTITPTTSLQRRAGRIPSVAAGESVKVEVAYKLPIKDNSSLAAITPSGVQLLPLSLWYPTPNNWFYPTGSDAAPTRIQITSGQGLTGVSSGTQTGDVFDQKYGVQPFVLTGSWDVSDRKGVSVYAPKNGGAEAAARSDEMAALLVEARTFAARYLGEPPAMPLRIVAVPRGAGFASGGTLLIDEHAFRRTKLDPVTAILIAEGAVRTWLGGSVSVTGEGYGIIRDGLTRFIATEFIESKFGKPVADVERLRQRNAYAGISKRDAPLFRASPLDDFYFAAVANKGAMAWRLLEKAVGGEEFRKVIAAAVADRSTSMLELRQEFAAQRTTLDYLVEQLTDTNLLIGIPQPGNGETRVALRNAGSIDATFNVRATLDNGSTLDAPVTLKAATFGEVAFKTPGRVTRVEIDTDKLYPQIDYSDDVAPREYTDSDPVLAIKKLFDRKDYSGAVKLGQSVIREMPRLDEARILVARSHLALGDMAAAEREFDAVLAEKLPTASSVSWAMAGKADLAARRGDKDAALKLISDTIAYDGDTGASFAVRSVRKTLGVAGNVDPGIRGFFAEFDRIAKSNRKPDLEGLFVAGSSTRFVNGIAGSTEEWKTDVRFADKIDNDTYLVETNTNLRLLTKDAEGGLVVYRIRRVGSGWKIAAVEIFEVGRV